MCGVVVGQGHCESYEELSRLLHPSSPSATTIPPSSFLKIKLYCGGTTWSWHLQWHVYIGVPPTHLHRVKSCPLFIKNAFPESPLSSALCLPQLALWLTLIPRHYSSNFLSSNQGTPHLLTFQTRPATRSYLIWSWEQSARLTRPSPSPPQRRLRKGSSILKILDPNYYIYTIYIEYKPAPFLAGSTLAVSQPSRNGNSTLEETRNGSRGKRPWFHRGGCRKRYTTSC